MSLGRLFYAISVALTALTVVQSTQVMHRPANYKQTPNRFSIEMHPKTNSIQKRATSRTNFAYFTNWGIYGADFQPTEIVSGPLTHVLYSFADADASTGNIKLTDSYADQEKHFPGDSWDEPGNNLYGCLKQLYLIKLRQRNFKVLLSVGGWTYSQAGHFNFVTSASARTNFVNDAVRLIEDYGFDGIDIDFEYPANSAQGQGLADLVSGLRSAFDDLAKRKGDPTPYLVTAAVPAGSANYAFLNIAQMNAGLNYWNLMAYDYAGSWLTWADNQANLYGGERTNVSTDAAVKQYLASGASASKINLGIPLYGRAFESTNGIGQPYSGIGPGTFEAGIYSYNTLPLAGAQVFENTTDVTSYSYDSSKKELVSYDTPNIVGLKAKYVIDKGLSGSMFWELSTDKVGSQSLVGITASAFGSLDQTLNHIKYPNSKWDNIRSNMGGISTPTTTSAPTSTSHSSTTVQPPSSTGSCAGLASWSAQATYNGGAKVTYNGHVWTAKWWTLGDTPGGPAGVWADGGAC